MTIRKLLFPAFLAALLLALPGCRRTPSQDLRRQLMGKICLDLRYWQARGASAPVPVTNLTAEMALALDALRPGAVILFAESCRGAEQTAALARQIAAAAREGGWPEPLLAVDREGGRVDRLEFAPALPSASALGFLDEADFTEKVARDNAACLRRCGFALDFAPVCDVDSNPLNPVINNRSFSSDPGVAARQAAAYARGLEAGGVLACAKHFPGHGDTDTDSHTGLPLVGRSLEQLRECELPPFRAAIAAGIPCVMTTHIQFPALDSSTLPGLEGRPVIRPATLSRTILQEVLRGELGFGGVIVSDDMDMEAISRTFEWQGAVLEAWKAGVDLAIVTKRLVSLDDLKVWEDFLDRGEAAVRSGAYPESELRRSLARLAELRRRLEASRAGQAPPDIPDPWERDAEYARTVEARGDRSLLPLQASPETVAQLFPGQPRLQALAAGRPGEDVPREPGLLVVVSNLAGSQVGDLPGLLDSRRQAAAAARQRGCRVLFLSLGCPQDADCFQEADLVLRTRGGTAGLYSLLFGDSAKEPARP